MMSLNSQVRFPGKDRVLCNVWGRMSWNHRSPIALGNMSLVRGSWGIKTIACPHLPYFAVNNIPLCIMRTHIFDPNFQDKKIFCFNF